MGYLFGEIVLYLVGAGLIGFVTGWLVRDGRFDKYFEKSTEVSSEKILEVSEVEVKETEKEVVKVESPTPAEILKESDEENKPTLFSKIPKEGQDKLSTIKGIGPVMEKKLNELGVYSFNQISSWNAEQEIWIGTQMAFPNKVRKEEWVKQAKELLNAK